MVQIAGPSPTPGDAQPLHPQQISVGPPGDVDSQAITRDSIEGETLRAGSLAGPPPKSAGTVFNDADVSIPSGPEPANPSVHEDSASPPVSPANLPIGWQSDRTRRARQIGLIATLSITGVVTAAVAFLFFVQHWKEKQSQQTETPVAVADPAEELAEVSTAQANPLDEAVGEQAAADESSDERTDPPPQDESADSEDTMAADEATDELALKEGASDQDAAEQDGLEQDEVATTEPKAANLAEQMADPILRPDPDDDDADERDNASAAQLPPGLQKYVSLLGGGDDGGQEEEQLEEPPAPDQVELEQPAEAEQTAFGPAEPINISNRLQFEVAFERKGAPLTQWLRILSQITGVPISLDVASLDAAGIAPTRVAEPATGWKTAELVLQAVAENAGCTMRKTESMVVIEANADAIAAGVAPALRADDLLADANERESLEQLVQRVTQAESVTIDPTDGEVTVEGNSGTAWLAALTLDGLRIARQLPPRLPRERTERWLAIDQGFDWPTVQGGRGIEPLDHPRAIISLVDEVANANDAAVVFAWGDLWERGLTPESTAMPWTAGNAGGEVLDEMLRPYNLQVRQMSDGLWWVGSETLYDRDRAVGLIHVAGQAGDEVIARLARSMGVSNDEQLPVTFDETSGYLVAHLPRFLLRQLPGLVAADANGSPPAP